MKPKAFTIIDMSSTDRDMLHQQLHQVFPDAMVREITSGVMLAALLVDTTVHHDCIVTDLLIDEAHSGSDLVITLRATFPESALIVWTDSGTEEIAVQCFRAGIDDYLIKSTTPVHSLPGIIINVLQKRGNAKAISSNEQRYRRLFDSVPIGLYRSSVDGRLLDVNQCFVEMLDYPNVEALIGTHSVDLYFDITDRDKWIEKVTRDGIVRDFQVRLKRWNGSELWVYENVRLTTDSTDGEAILEGSVQSIASFMNAMAALQISERQYRRITENMSDVVCECDTIGVFNYISPSMSAVLGFSPTAKLGTSLLDLVNEEQYDSVLHALDELRQLSRKVDLELLIQKSQGNDAWFNLSISPIRDETDSLTGILVRIRDIAREKKAEQEKAAIQGQLIHSQKMEAIGRLAAGLAHDFKNILTAIRGYSDLIMLELGESHPVGRDIISIQTATTRAMTLIRQLLIFSRIQPVQIEIVDLNFIIENILLLLRRMIGEDVHFALALDPGLHKLKADPGSIEQIVLNLAVNARDAMKKGGEIRIETRNVWLDTTSIRNQISRGHSAFVALSITDTGSGIDPKVLPMIFEPFFTTKTAQSTGLGLAVVYGIVNQHGGWIDVQSQLGIGSTFTIMIPAAGVIAENSASEKNDIEDIVIGTGQTILVVEDEEDLRIFVDRALRHRNFNVLTAKNGKEAIQMFESNRNRIDLVFTDMILPDIHGMEVVRAIRRIDSDVRILLTSGYVSKSIEWREVEQSGFQLLRKPYQLSDLIAYIHATLNEL